MGCISHELVFSVILSLDTTVSMPAARWNEFGTNKY